LDCSWSRFSDSNTGGRCHGEIDIESEHDRDQHEQNSGREYKSTVHEVSHTSGALRSVSSRFRRFPDPGLTNSSAHAASAGTINQAESGIVPSFLRRTSHYAYQLSNFPHHSGRLLVFSQAEKDR
jgi:hypothetical protein